MNILIRITIPLGLTMATALGGTWTGRLIDAACHERDPGAAGQARQQPSPNTTQNPTSCSATPTTSVFALQTNEGQVYSLDTFGNAKAMDVVRKSPGRVSSVVVTGAMDGQLLKVESLEAGEAVVTPRGAKP